MNVNRRGFFAILVAAIAPIAPARWWRLRLGRTNAEPLRIGKWGGIQAYWLDEKGIALARAAYARNPVQQIRLVDIRLKKSQSLVRVTDELLADSSSIADIVAKKEKA